MHVRPKSGGHIRLVMANTAAIIGLNIGLCKQIDQCVRCLQEEKKATTTKPAVDVLDEANKAFFDIIDKEKARLEKENKKFSVGHRSLYSILNSMYSMYIKCMRCIFSIGLCHCVDTIRRYNYCKVQ